jgi:hypothetical protein
MPGQHVNAGVTNRRDGTRGHDNVLMMSSLLECPTRSTPLLHRTAVPYSPRFTPLEDDMDVDEEQLFVESSLLSRAHDYQSTIESEESATLFPPVSIQWGEPMMSDARKEVKAPTTQWYADYQVSGLLV